MIIRPATYADASAIARVHVASWRAAYVGVVPPDYLANLSTDRSAAMWRRQMLDPAGHALILVAEDATDGVIGFISGGPERGAAPEYQGEIYALYLLPDWRRRGVGRRLVMQAAAWLFDHGLTTMLVWALTDNSARAFYEALGGRNVREQWTIIGGQRLPQTGYGWDDLTPLLIHNDNNNII